MKRDLVIAVTGSHGFLGTALVRRLKRAGHTVLPLPRKPAILPGADALIHLAGESPAGLWTPRKKRAIRESRIQGTRQLVDRIPLAVSPPRVFLCASASGYYGHRPGEPLEEVSAPGTGFRARTCVDWEAEASRAEAYGIRTVRLRFGSVLDPAGGYLGHMLPLLRRGLCFVLGDPGDRFAWISLEDAVRMIEFALENESIRGALNVTAPVAATQGAFARAASRLAGRRVLGRLRSGLLRSTLGDFASAFVDVQDVAPARALRGGFAHVHPTLEYWSRSLDPAAVLPARAAP